MSLYRDATEELAAVLDRIDDASVEAACEMIAGANKLMLYGLGREALQLRGFCMRLFHLGRRASMAFDVTAPPMGHGDLFIACAGPGYLSTVEPLMRIARDAGAKVLLITAQPDAQLAPLANHVLVIPAQTMANDQSDAASRVLPMGSAFEGALFVLFEVMIAKLKVRLGVTAEEMRARHTNME